MTRFSIDHESPIAPTIERANRIQIHHAEVDPDMKRVQDHPRFNGIIVAKPSLDMAVESEAVRARDA